MHSVYTKTLWDSRRSYWWWVAGLAAIVFLMSIFYPLIAEDVDAWQELLELYPEGFLAIFNIDLEQFTTGAGYLSGELYSLMLPIIVIIFTVLRGASATAGEEHEGTMDLLLGAPVLRSRVVIDKFAAAGLLTAGLGAALVVSLLIANPIFDLGLGMEGLIAINLNLVLLALLFGAVALLLGAWTGSRAVAGGAAAALAVASFFAHSLASLTDVMDIPQKLSPFYWYIGNDPFIEGFSWFHTGLLVLVTAALFALAVYAFTRRDIGIRGSRRRPRVTDEGALSSSG